MRKNIPLLTLAICVLLLSASDASAQVGCSLSGSNQLPGTPLAGNLNQPIDNGLLTDGAELSRLFSIDPAIFYLQEAGDPNAFAFGGRLPELLAAEGRPDCCQDGTVLIGLKLIKSEWRATGGTGLSIPAILAHEYAHIAQLKYNSPLQGKWRELHADYLAGWYIARRGLSLTANNPYQAMASFFWKGEYSFNSPMHHGTPQERLAAFRMGYALVTIGSGSPGMRAYQEGLNYLKLLGAPVR